MNNWPPNKMFFINICLSLPSIYQYTNYFCEISQKCVLRQSAIFPPMFFRYGILLDPLLDLLHVTTTLSTQDGAVSIFPPTALDSGSTRESSLFK